MSDPWEYAETVGTTGGDRFPWPPDEDGPILGAFGDTWKSATFDPAAFFARIPRDRGTGPALLYFLVLVLLVAGATLFWDSLSLLAGGLEDNPWAAGLGIEALHPVVGFLLTPVVLLAMLFVSAGLTHLLLSMLDGARHGFGTTLRTFCYAYSPGVFGVVPVFGGLVGSVWMVVLLIIGLREAHQADGWKSAVAVLLPVALLVGLMVFAFLMLVAASAAVFGGMTG